MSVGVFLKLTALTTGVIGLLFSLWPHFVATFFLVQVNHDSNVFIRYLGSSLLGYSALNWFSSKQTPIVLRPVLWGNGISLALATVISSLDLINHVVKPTGWLILLLHVGFGSGFAAYLYQQQRAFTALPRVVPEK